MTIGAKIMRQLTAPKTFSSTSTRNISAVGNYNYKAITVSEPVPFVRNVALNRPNKMNAMNRTMGEEIGDVFTKLDQDQDCRTIILSGEGRMFTSGIDLSDLSELISVVYGDEDVARKSMYLYHNVRQIQGLISCVEKCRKPVICCVHNACVGAGVDLITATDIRLCTSDAWFCVKEVDMGLAADVGTLQRLPRVIGSQSLVNELCLTARKMKSEEAERCGLVSEVHQTKEEMLSAAVEMAASIARKSPVAVQGTKVNLLYSRDHSVEEGLDMVAKWNMTMLQSEDVMKSAMAAMDKTGSDPPEFEKF